MKKLNVKYGDLVEEGQVLLEMDSGILKTEIENKIREVSILETAFNQKILKTGFEFQYSLDRGIKELVDGIQKLEKGNYTNNLEKIDL